MQPGTAVGSGHRDDRPVRAVHHHRIVFGGSLLGERVAVVPDCAGIGGVVGGGHG